VVETTTSVILTGPTTSYVYHLELDELVDHLNFLVGSPISLTMLSYFARAERTIFVAEFIKVPPRTDWFDLFSFFHPQEDDQGVLENLSMLSTMYE
jgi:hypothetical protein